MAKSLPECKLKDLLNPDNCTTKEFKYGDLSFIAPIYNPNNLTIWGATAMMLSEFLEIARKNAKLKNVSNIRFLNLDISEKVTKEDVKADLITNRFLLLHLKNDKKAIQNMLSLLKPEGYLISQDAIMTGVMAGPESAAFNQFSYYFNEHLRKQNKNPNIGADLFSLYQECGLTDIEMNVVQPVLYTTREKSLMQLSFVAIKESLLRLGLMSESEFEELNKQLISELDNPRQICFPGRLTQITGKYKSH